MPITTSHLRDDIYNILDSVIESGHVVEIIRKGRIIRIVADQPPSRLARLKKRDCIAGNPGDLVEIDWSADWTPGL